MPSSVTDRPTTSHEYLFLLSKSARYYYDFEAIKEPADPKSNLSWERNGASKDLCVPGQAYSQHRPDRKQDMVGKRWRRDIYPNMIDLTKGQPAYPVAPGALTRNKRSVWTISTHAFPEAHFATFPPALVEPCILAGSSPQACPVCGVPWKRIVEKSGGTIGKSWNDHNDDMGAGMSQVHFGLSDKKIQETYRVETVGWSPTCSCPSNDGSGHCIVLDPFMGSGTTALVAFKYGRDYVGIELNPEYVEMANRRLSKAVCQERLFV